MCNGPLAGEFTIFVNDKTEHLNPYSIKLQNLSHLINRGGEESVCDGVGIPRHKSRTSLQRPLPLQLKKRTIHLAGTQVMFPVDRVVLDKRKT